MTTTATKLNAATITRKLNAAGYSKASWIRNGTHTTEGFMTGNTWDGNVAVEYVNHGGTNDITDDFIARQVLKIADIATSLEQLGYAIAIKNGIDGLSYLIVKGA